MVDPGHRAPRLAIGAIVVALATLLASCQVAAPPGEGEPPETPTAAPDGADTHLLPPTSPTIAQEILLGPEHLLESEFTSGLDLGTPEPKEEVASPYQDGRTLFAFRVDDLGGTPGREVDVVMMNVRAGQRLELPHRRARVAFIPLDVESGPISAEAGYLVIETADADHLTGRFEVRFDELDAAVVRGSFDTRWTPAR